MARVILENLFKQYNQAETAVKGINLKVEDREFMVLVGPSGCGKTTTLRMIAGLEEITSGKILIDDICVNHTASKDRDIAMVFQNYALFPHMTIYENMAFGLKRKALAAEVIKERIIHTAHILDISRLLDRKPDQLSGGQKQRVALGRAMVVKPSVFLMDEPLSNLDAKLRVQMRTELIRLHQRLKTTFIYVTHDQTEAMTMGSRICVMNEGEIQQVDTPQMIYDHPANKFVAQFIGLPHINLLEGCLQIEGESAIVNVEGVKIPLMNANKIDSRLKPYRDQKLILGIRPEGIKRCEQKKACVSYSAVIEMVEHLGSHLNVHFKVGDYTLVSRMSSEDELCEGQEVFIAINQEKLHLFDIKTGVSILA